MDYNNNFKRKSKNSEYNENFTEGKRKIYFPSKRNFSNSEYVDHCKDCGHMATKFKTHNRTSKKHVDLFVNNYLFANFSLNYEIFHELANK